MTDKTRSVYLVSAECVVTEKRHHLKLAAYSVEDAKYMASVMDVDAVVVGDIMWEGRPTDNEKLLQYATGKINVFDEKK